MIRELRTEPGRRRKIWSVKFQLAVKPAEPDFACPGLETQGALLGHLWARVRRREHFDADLWGVLQNEVALRQLNAVRG